MLYESINIAASSWGS